MAAKLLHFLTDDYPDLQKQIGYMTGIIQLFDRQQMGAYGRRLSDQWHSKTLQHKPCHSQFTDGSLEKEFIVAHQRQPADMNSNRSASDRQRISTESSKASYSSSRSSSFSSSVDYYRGTQPDSAYSDRIAFLDAASEDSHHSVSPRIARQSAAFRDIVKDSILKEARGLSIKTTSRQSAEVPSKLQGSVWAYNERNEQQRASDRGYRSKAASRISYDEMETSRLSFDSRDALSTSKVTDLPRLSLDGRDILMRRIDCNLSSNFQLDTSLKRSCSTKENGQNLREVSVTQQRQSPSLIAKLMGLTALPDSTLATQNDRSSSRTPDAEDWLVTFNPRKPILDSKPPSSKEEPSFPRWISSEKKPISSSRIPAEQAPWKNKEKGATLLKQSSRRIISPRRQSNPIPSVYSEIEKRFKDIEFNQSGKNLRALKHILESIHAEGLLEDEKREQASKFATSGKQESMLIKANQKIPSAGHQNARGKHLAEIVPRHDNLSRASDSQSVIIKQISKSPRSQVNKNAHKDHVVGSNEKCKSTKHTGKTQQQPKDNSASSPRNLGSTSPRICLKKLASEKQSQFPNHSSDAKRHRVQVSKQPNELSSPGRKVQPRPTNKQKNCSQISEILLELKNLRSQTNEEPLSADRSVALDSGQVKEAARTMRSNNVNGSHNLSRKASKQVGLDSNKSSNQISLPVKQDETAPEHPSPVSVLYLSPYMDDSSTEEKQLAAPPEDLAEGYGAFMSNLGSELGITSEISRRKLLSIDSLVQKLKRLNSAHDESKTDYIALLCDDTNPDHRYISEILLASGLLLQEFGSNAKPFQLHPSGFLINPELFNVLEQTKSSAHPSKSAYAIESKSHWKLIFDTVNEMLTNKLISSGNLADYTVKLKHHHSLAKKAVNTQNLIKELCAEMEQLQPKKKKHENKLENEDESDAVKDLLWEDVKHRSSDRWNAFEGGMAEVVLDIERWLYKKLVNEVVISAYGLRPKSGRQHHSRFMK